MGGCSEATERAVGYTGGSRFRGAAAGIVTTQLIKELTLETIAEWIAPAATMIAAIMTAANLGARVTGWGFVVFAVGSVCWSLVGLHSGQTNLLTANGFLTLINLVGIWRWLGRQRAYEEGGKSATAASRRASTPNLFTATGIAGMTVEDAAGTAWGKAVEALIECRTGEVSYVVVATGRLAGLDEELRAVPRDHISFGCDRLMLKISPEVYGALDVLAPGEWPANAERGERA